MLRSEVIIHILTGTNSQISNSENLNLNLNIFINNDHKDPELAQEFSSYMYARLSMT